MHAHTHTHARTHTHTHTHTQASSHARTHTYANTHTRARALPQGSIPTFRAAELYSDADPDAQAIMNTIKKWNDFYKVAT